VIAYEPDPLLHAILCRNVARNGYANVEARRSAVADAAGTAMFYRAKNTGDNRLFSHGPRDDRDSFSVSTVTLDEDLAGLDRRIDLLKMDIQGAEPLALAGMQTLLKAAPPRRMLVEFWPHGIAGMGNDPREFVATLRGAGYRVTAMGERDDLDLDAALRELTPDNKKWVNLECTHESEPVDG
jgi:FkbM family methyltransferase